MKTYIGIDVSSQKLNICVLSNDKFSNYVIINSVESLETFIKDKHIKSNNTVVGVESTGRYHLICQNTFVKKGYEFRVINPILTSQKIRSSIRKKKTDKTDAQLIVNLLMQGEGKLVTEDQLDTTRRSILRAEKKLIDYKTSIDKIVKGLEREQKNDKMYNTIDRIESLVDDLEECIKDVDKEALSEEDITKTEELIDSIPGFAKKLSAIVVTEVRDFSRFPSSNEFKAYVGIDSRVIQSGNICHLGKITKRGNAHLRHAFYLAAQVARQHDPQLKAFYSKKKLEGKPTRVCICAVARKLCERVFAVVQRGSPYIVRS